MSLRDDYLMRLIEQLAQVIARMTGLNLRKDYRAALETAQRAGDELAVPPELVDRLDGPELAKLLREPSKMRLAAQLLTEEATALAGSGDPIHATLRRKRAYQLYAAAHALDPQDTDDE